MVAAPKKLELAVKMPDKLIVPAALGATDQVPPDAPPLWLYVADVPWQILPGPDTLHCAKMVFIEVKLKKNTNKMEKKELEIFIEFKIKHKEKRLFIQ